MTVTVNLDDTHDNARWLARLHDGITKVGQAGAEDDILDAVAPESSNAATT